MKRAWFYILIPLLIFNSCNDDDSQANNEELELITKKTLSPENRDFILFLVPKIKIANADILSIRKKVESLKQELETEELISRRNLKWLTKVAIDYGFKKLKFSKSTEPDQLKQNIETLLKRVDIVPLKMVMAQACAESEWGRSRFAEEGFNYFGIHCYSKGCGIVPNHIPNPKFEVKSYNSPEDGITDYLRIINTVTAYKQLRSIRAEMRDSGQDPDAMKLIQGLSSYSEKGSAYISLLNNLITNYLPENIEEIN